MDNEEPILESTEINLWRQILEAEGMIGEQEEITKEQIQKYLENLSASLSRIAQEMSVLWQNAFISLYNQMLYVDGAINQCVELLVNQFDTLIQVGYENLVKLITSEGFYLIKNFNWLLPPGLSHDFYKALQELLAQRPSQSQVDQFYCDWFRNSNFEELSNLITAWDSAYFGDWREPLEQALENHKRGWYYASVPLLLIIFDGISVAYYKSAINPRHDPGSPKGVFQVWEKQYEGNKINHTLLQQISHLLETYVFSRAAEKTPDGPPLNRNLAMHGRDKDYATEANSIRCFLLLQTLHYFMV